MTRPLPPTQPLTLTPRATAELVVLALLWGGSFLAVRTALDEIGVLTSVAWRVTPAAALLWVWVWLRRLPVPHGFRIWAAFLVMGLLNNIIPFTLMAWAQLHIESGLTSILNATTALFAAALAALFFRDERLTPRKLAGLGLGFAGVLAAIGPGALGGLDLRSAAQLAVLAGALSYALAALWGRARLSRVRPEVAAAGMLTGSAAIAIPLALVAEGPPALALGPATWAAIGYYALASTALAYLLYYRVLATAGAANIGFVTLMLPPIAIALGALARGEALAPHAFLGLALLAAGLALLDGRIVRAFGRRG